MKIIYVFSFFLLTSCSGSTSDDSGTQNFNATDSIKEFEMNEGRLSAVDFNNELTLMQERTLDLVYTLFQSDSSNIDLNMENTLFEIEMNLNRLQKLEAPNLGEAYLQNTEALMVWYQSELKDNFNSTVAPIIKKSTLNGIDKETLRRYDLFFAEQEKELFDSIFIAQENFAKANNIKLEE